MTPAPVELPPDAGLLRTRLAGTCSDITRLFAQREHLITAARDAGIGRGAIMATAECPMARTVAEVIDEHEKTQRETRFAATEQLWGLGNVIEDQYGLRWRADIHEHRGRGWFCRSVRLRVFCDGAAMAERGPLKLIRKDRVFASNAGSEERLAARAAREAGQTEDEAVTVTAPEDPEWIPVRFPVLLIEALATVDGRIIDGGGVSAGNFPMPLLLHEDGPAVPVGRIDTLTRTVGVARRRDGTPFPSGVAVWSGTGAIHGFTQAEVGVMTQKLSPEADLTRVELDDAEVSGWTRITSGVLSAVVLGSNPAFADAYWTVGEEPVWCGT